MSTRREAVREELSQWPRDRRARDSHAGRRATLRDVRERRRVRRLRTGNTPEKLAEDARRARRGTPARYRSSAVPALKAAVAMWLWRGPLR
jgi:hypothetical protein